MKRLLAVLTLLALPVSAMGFGLPMTSPQSPVQPFEYKDAIQSAKNQADSCQILLDTIQMMPIDQVNDPEGDAVLNLKYMNIRNLAMRSCKGAADAIESLNQKIWLGGYDQYGPQIDPNAP